MARPIYMGVARLAKVTSLAWQLTLANHLPNLCKRVEIQVNSLKQYLPNLRVKKGQNNFGKPLFLGHFACQTCQTYGINTISSN